MAQQFDAQFGIGARRIGHRRRAAGPRPPRSGARRGEYRWPEWFDARRWAQYEANPCTWTSLYQQMPVPPEDLFRTEKIVMVDIIPSTWIDWVRGWDLASVEDDWTAGAKLGRLLDGR